MTTAAWLHQVRKPLSRARRGRLTRLATRSPGGRVTGRRQLLATSAAYPKNFCRKVAQLFLAASGTVEPVVLPHTEETRQDLWSDALLPEVVAYMIAHRV